MKRFILSILISSAVSLANGQEKDLTFKATNYEINGVNHDYIALKNDVALSFYMCNDSLFEEFDNLLIMKITGIAINHQPLVVPEHANTTNCFHAFMVYCINNYQIQIRNSETLKKWFKLSSKYPDFNRAMHYKRIHGCNGLYYTDWRGTKQKESVMVRIANELNFELTLEYEVE